MSSVGIHAVKEPPIESTDLHSHYQLLYSKIADLEYWQTRMRRKKNVKKGIQFCLMVCGASGTGASPMAVCIAGSEA